MHTFEEDNNVPEIYAHDPIVKQNKLNPVETVSSMGFDIDIPVDKQNLQPKDKVFTMKFSYSKSGDLITVY